jgi:hypothetical protein
LIYVVNVEYRGSMLDLQKRALVIAQARGETMALSAGYMNTVKGLLEDAESETEQRLANEEFSPETVDVKDDPFNGKPKQIPAPATDPAQPVPAPAATLVSVDPKPSDPNPTEEKPLF